MPRCTSILFCHLKRQIPLVFHVVDDANIIVVVAGWNLPSLRAALSFAIANRDETLERRRDRVLHGIKVFSMRGSGINHIIATRKYNEEANQEFT